MPTSSKGGWAALHDIQERKRREREPPPSAGLTPPLYEPVHDANPSVLQTRPASEPVAVPDAYPSDSDVTTPPQRTPPQAEPVRQTKGYVGVTNHLLDDVLPTLEPAEQVVLLRLYRLSRGHRQARCKVSLGTLVTKTRVKKTRLRDALLTLEDRGYIKRLHDDVASANVYDRGMNFEMLLAGVEPIRPANPSAPRTRPSGAPNKEEQFKEKGINITPSSEDLEEYERARKELEEKSTPPPRQ